MGEVTVRTADIEDLIPVVYLCGEMVEQSLYKHMGFDARYFGEYALGFVLSENTEVFIAQQDGDTIGALLCSVGQGVTSPSLIGWEHGFFVRPERRSLRAARLLVETYIKWAEDMGAKRINVGNSAGMDDDKFQKLMRRFGFSHAGSIMYMHK